MLLDPLQHATEILVMLPLSFSEYDDIVRDILASREACKYFFNCVLENLGEVLANCRRVMGKVVQEP